MRITNIILLQHYIRYSRVFFLSLLFFYLFLIFCFGLFHSIRYNYPCTVLIQHGLWNIICMLIAYSQLYLHYIFIFFCMLYVILFFYLYTFFYWCLLTMNRSKKCFPFFQIFTTFFICFSLERSSNYYSNWIDSSVTWTKKICYSIWPVSIYIHHIRYNYFLLKEKYIR